MWLMSMIVFIDMLLSCVWITDMLTVYLGHCWFTWILAVWEASQIVSCPFSSCCEYISLKLIRRWLLSMKVFIDMLLPCVWITDMLTAYLGHCWFNI